jgi:hypothetical protein
LQQHCVQCPSVCELRIRRRCAACVVRLRRK